MLKPLAAALPKVNIALCSNSGESGGATTELNLIREQLGSDPGTPQSKAQGENTWRTALLSCHYIPLLFNLEAASEGPVLAVSLPFDSLP